MRHECGSHTGRCVRCPPYSTPHQRTRCCSLCLTPPTALLSARGRARHITAACVGICATPVNTAGQQLPAHPAAADELVEDLGHAWCVVQEHEALADHDVVRLIAVLIQTDQQLQHLQAVTVCVWRGGGQAKIQDSAQTAASCAGGECHSAANRCHTTQGVTPTHGYWRQLKSCTVNRASTPWLVKHKHSACCRPAPPHAWLAVAHVCHMEYTWGA